MGYIVPKHIYRTADNRLVPHGDLDAAFLAYPAGTEMTDHEAEQAGVLDVYPATKAVTEHGDKSVTLHGDKAEEPKKSGSKTDWVEYAVSKGADRAEAEASTRDDLVAAYGSSSE